MIIPTNTRRIITANGLPASFSRALVSFIDRQPVNIGEAAAQLRIYYEFIDTTGFCREAIRHFNMPDEIFKQDHGLPLGKRFLAARLTTLRRREIDSTLARLRKLGFEILMPPAGATFEGGDTVVTWFDDPAKKTIFVGQRKKHTPRTNAEGFAWVKAEAEKLGHRVIAVPFEHCLHLSTGASFLGCSAQIRKPAVVYNREWVNPQPFIDAGLDALPIEPGEPFAANTVRFGENGVVVVRSDYTNFNHSLLQMGFNTVPTPWDQMALGEGGFTCCLLPVEI